jgi:hypothetical protein
VCHLWENQPFSGGGPVGVEVTLQIFQLFFRSESAAIIAYLDRKMADEATDDPEEIRRAKEELAEFKRNMNANSAAAGERLVYP